jgi:heat shock protein HtpX
MGVTTPKLYFFPETVPSAFSIGCRRHHSSLVFSEGLLNHLSDNELRAVIAHELAKIQRGETKALILTSALARAILFFPQILDKIITLGKSQDQASSQSWQPLTQIFAPFAGFIVRLSINRNVYYESDRRAAELLGDSRELAKVLWKMESYAQTKPILLPATSSHLFTVNPLTSLGWNRYFHCQPPIDQRIRGLVGHFPI